MKQILLVAFLLSFVLSVDGFAQSFSFKRIGPAVVTTPYYADSLQFIQIQGVVKNNSTTDSLKFRFVRIINNLPNSDWHTQMCYDLCYGPENDSIPLENTSGYAHYTIPPSHADTFYYIDFQGTSQGLGMAVVRMENYLNPSDFVQDTFKVQIGTVGIQQVSNIVEDYKLSQNYPNPFNPSTVINFSIPRSENVSLKIYNALGKEVAALLNSERLAPGSYNYEFNVNSYNLSSGLYYYTFTSGDFVQTKKMMLIK
jgi:hypothetical protein